MGQQSKILTFPFLRYIPITKYANYSQGYLPCSIHINIKLDLVKVAKRKNCLSTFCYTDMIEYYISNKSHSQRFKENAPDTLVNECIQSRAYKLSLVFMCLYLVKYILSLLTLFSPSPPPFYLLSYYSLHCPLRGIPFFPGMISGIFVRQHPEKG